MPSISIHSSKSCERRCCGTESTPGIEGSLKALLHADGLAYSSKAKAFIVFHRHPSGPRTAFEEQLRESAHYARDAHGNVRIHFTVAAEHLSKFQEELRRTQGPIEAETESRFVVSFSIQHPSTDTLAIDSEGGVARNADGSLLFRPGGHGALIRNLEETGGDLVVVKNIDNILPSDRQEETARWKRDADRIAGGPPERSARTFTAHSIAEGASRRRGRAAGQFLEVSWQRKDPVDSRNLREQVIERLDRPWRVCGVVRNEGEPGGAPFWVHDAHGRLSVQIVESSQVDMADDEQAQIWRAATHFNPVDLVCGLRDAGGRVTSSTISSMPTRYSSPEISWFARAESAGVAGPLERRNGALEHRPGRSSCLHLRAGKDRLRPSETGTSAGIGDGR